MDRRLFLSGMLAAAVAPAFIKTAGLLMPIKPLIVEPTFLMPEGFQFAQQGKVWVATYEYIIAPDSVTLAS